MNFNYMLAVFFSVVLLCASIYTYYNGGGTYGV